MPKLKTNKAAAKRFKRTKNGKIKRGKAYGRHIMTKKSAKRKRNLRKSAIVDPSEMGRIRRLLPNG